MEMTHITEIKLVRSDKVAMYLVITHSNWKKWALKKLQSMVTLAIDFFICNK